MNLWRKFMSNLSRHVESKADRKPRPGRARRGSLVEQLEARAMLSQVNLGPTIVVPPPRLIGPAVIFSTRAPVVNVHTSVPAGAAAGIRALDVTEGGGQIGVQLVEKLDVTEGGGQIGVQLVDRLGSRLST
jgi:hypothetical protein